jgi:ribosome-associated protein
MHLAEHWRERLIADDRVFDEFVQATDCGDLQALRTNIRAARVEHTAQRNGRQYRLLYQRIRAAMAPRSGPENGQDGEPDGAQDRAPDDLE